MLYGEERLKSFAEKMNIKPEILCGSEKGRSIPVIRFGEGKNTILLTARHHACESTGSYVLEGVLEELYRNPVPDCRVTAVPFVDFDGVIDGDQGKNRAPHDHNRDYADNSIYASVREIKRIIETENIKYAFDFHSPWHLSGRNDKLFLVRNNMEDMPKYLRFGEILKGEAEKTAESMKYNPKDDINPGEEWNKSEDGLKNSFSSFCADYTKKGLSVSLETPYFGEPDNIVTQKKLISTGHAFAHSIEKYNDSVKIS
jgi:hypothetical protein